jgi:hypothetical protein
VAIVNTPVQQDVDTGVKGGNVGTELNYVQNNISNQGVPRPRFVPQGGNVRPGTPVANTDSRQGGGTLGEPRKFTGTCHFCREVGHMKRECEAWKAEKIKRKANQDAQQFVGRVQQVNPGQSQQYASTGPSSFYGQGYYTPSNQQRYVPQTGYYGQPVYRPQQFVQRPRYVQGPQRFVQRQMVPFAQAPQRQFLQRPQQQFVPRPSYWVPREAAYQVNAVQVVEDAAVPLVDVAALALPEAETGVTPVYYEQVEAVEFQAAGYSHTPAEQLPADVAGK